MTARFACTREADVQQAAASGRWPAALAQHARACPTCADVRLISEAFATAAPDATPLTRIDPALLFARARQERRLQAEAQISRVATVTHVAVLLGVLGVALYFVPTPSFDWVTEASWPTLEFAMPSDPSAWVYGAGGFLMASLFVLSRWTSQDA